MLFIIAVIGLFFISYSLYKLHRLISSYSSKLKLLGAWSLNCLNVLVMVTGVYPYLFLLQEKNVAKKIGINIENPISAVLLLLGLVYWIYKFSYVVFLNKNHQ
ncbi:hypothetical protein [Thiofilum flexile]|uniref:hypothetical protein n=1 Tax=Thiofilum flexile TaxID=125627 RepID=UPI00036004DC|nr:hypothetical protein [Thiofilum flexile]